jgi:hypothetical protein
MFQRNVASIMGFRSKPNAGSKHGKGLVGMWYVAETEGN